MKTISHALIIVVAAGAGLALGVAWRGRAVSDDTPSAVSQESETVSNANAARISPAKELVPAQDSSPLATQLERDLSMSSGVTRWLYWFEAIEKAAPDDFPRLLRLAEGNAAAKRLLTDRWIELYPQHVFDTVMAGIKTGQTVYYRNIADQLFRDWPKRDPDAAIAALSGPNNFAMRDSWRHSLVASLAETDPERALPLFAEWSILNFGPRTSGISKWAAADPRHAAEFALAHPAGFASELAVEAIAKEWAKTDPAGALQFATGRQDGLSVTLATAGMKAWATRNLNDAAAWLATADPGTRNRLSPPLVETWAKSDVNAALAWSEANLSGSSLALAVGGVVKGVADKDLPAAAALVTSMSPSSARAEAAAAIARKMFPDPITTQESVKPGAVAWIGALDPESASRVLDAVQWSWASNDPKGMASFLASSGERFSQSTYTILANLLAQKNPLEALDWAKRLPEDRGLEAGATAFAEWRRSQPEAATKWLEELPAGDARRQPYIETAIRRIVWDPQVAATRLAGLNAADRVTARKVIEEAKIPDDQRAQLLEILKTP